MGVIAVHSAKGGVGKTTLAVGLAWAAAATARRHTLLWDLDAQGAATHVLARGRAAASARDVLERDVTPARGIVATEEARLSMLPADASIRGLDAVFAAIDRRKRLRRVLRDVERDYDHVLLDCPPGLGNAAEQVIRAADLIVVPVIPSTLSRRAFEEVRYQVGRRHGIDRLLPVFTLVDRRRSIHRAALAAEPGWPVVPMASVAEQMADRRAAVAAYAPACPVARATAELWVAIERRLARSAARAA